MVRTVYRWNGGARHISSLASSPIYKRHIQTTTYTQTLLGSIDEHVVKGSSNISDIRRPLAFSLCKTD
jgi:hypothetical protein